MSLPATGRPGRPSVRRLGACLAACLALQLAHATEPAQPPGLPEPAAPQSPPAHATGGQPARLLKPAVPEYPPTAQRNGQEGTVHVRVRVLANDQPGDAQVVKGSGVPALDAAALASVRRSRFSAARDASGAPVDSWALVPFRFELQ